MITLATLNEATEQQVFDQVVKNLIRQNAPSITHRGCNYRTVKEDGTVLKCAAGWLMSDEEYKPEMDGAGDISGTDWRSLVKANLVPSAHKELIAELQSIHDNYGVEDWDHALQNLAYQEGLHYNTI